MFGQIGVPSIFWGSQNLGDPLREKEYVLNYDKKRVTNLELILTHMHRTGRQRLFVEPLHSFLDNVMYWAAKYVGIGKSMCF